MRRSLLTAALACVLVAGVASEAAAAGRGPDCNGARELCQRHLDEVVLPGAHNAMSALDLGWRIPNQSLAIPDQLERGIRALLVDTHYGRLQADGTVRTDDDGQVTVGSAASISATSSARSAPRHWSRSCARSATSSPRSQQRDLIDNEDHVAPGDFAARGRGERPGRLRLQVDPAPSGRPCGR